MNYYHIKYKDCSVISMESIISTPHKIKRNSIAVHIPKHIELYRMNNAEQLISWTKTGTKCLSEFHKSEDITFKQIDENNLFAYEL